MEEDNRFNLTADDEEAVRLAIDTMRAILRTRSKNLSAMDIIGLGNMLYALDNMPDSTPGVWCEVGVVYRVEEVGGEIEYGRMNYVSFSITEDDLEISLGGSVYSSDIGGDSFSEPGWIVSRQSESVRGCDLNHVESMLVYYLGKGAKVSVHDESDIDYDWDKR